MTLNVTLNRRVTIQSHSRLVSSRSRVPSRVPPDVGSAVRPVPSRVPPDLGSAIRIPPLNLPAVELCQLGAIAVGGLSCAALGVEVYRVALVVRKW